MAIKVLDVKLDIEEAKTLVKCIRKNKNKPRIVLNSLITLFSDVACILTAFPYHEEILDFIQRGISREELDIILFAVNSVIKDYEKLLAAMDNNKILYDENGYAE